MIKPALFICEPVIFESKIKVYPPKVKDVVSMPQYNLFLKLLTIDQDDIKEKYIDKISGNFPTPLEYLLINCYYDKDFRQLAQDAFQYFIHENINFSFEDKSILIGDLIQITKTTKSKNDLIILNNDNYFDFQNIIREVCGLQIEKPPLPEDPDEDPRIRRIKEKARLRDRIKAKKGSANSLSLSASLAAICCMGIGITPLNIGEMSYASISTILHMYQSKETYERDVECLLAGADSKKIKPKYWIRNLED